MLPHEWRKGPFVAWKLVKKTESKRFQQSFLGMEMGQGCGTAEIESWVFQHSHPQPAGARAAPHLHSCRRDLLRASSATLRARNSKSLLKNGKAGKKFQTSFGVGIDKVKHLEKKRFEQLLCYAKAGTGTTSWDLGLPPKITGSACDQGVFKVAAK